MMRTFRLLLFCALIVCALSAVVAKSKYPKTSPCPVDGNAAKATGKTKSTLDPQCVAVEYQHKGTDYTSPLHPQRFRHEFWLTICNDGTTGPTPAK